jgi:K+ transporter
MAGIFILQRFGTSKIGIAFAPILSTFFLVNAAIGIYNIQKWDTTIFKVSSVLFFEYSGFLLQALCFRADDGISLY